MSKNCFSKGGFWKSVVEHDEARLLFEKSQPLPCPYPSYFGRCLITCNSEHCWALTSWELFLLCLNSFLVCQLFQMDYLRKNSLIYSFWQLLLLLPLYQSGNAWALGSQIFLLSVLVRALEIPVTRNSHGCYLYTWRHTLTELLVFSFHSGAERNQSLNWVAVLFVLTYWTALICLLNFKPLFIHLALVQMPSSVSVVQNLEMSIPYQALLLCSAMWP